MVIEELFTRLGFKVDPKGIDKAKDKLAGFKKWVGGLALGAGFAAIAKTGVEAAMTMESLNAEFRVMTGSAERAKNLLGEIAEFAASTPFDKIGLSDAGKTLMAFGIEAEKVVPTLRMLGDVAGADQNKLKSLALVFGQIQSAGKLQGQDWHQLINVGFNPLKIMAEQTELSMNDLQTAMSKGAISAEMVTLAFKAATSEGGLFFGNLEAQSQTLQGRISTLKDNVVTALQNMAEAFLPMLKAGVDMLIAFDWTPVVASIQSFATALSSIPFETVIAWARRLTLLVIALAVKHFQGQLITAFTAITTAGASAFSKLTLSVAGFRTTAIASAKAVGLAMKTALGPIGIALMAIEGFVTAYQWLAGKTREAATESQKKYAKQFLDQQSKGGKTREQVMQEQLSQQEGRKARIKRLQEISAQGGAEGRKAAAELAGAQLYYNKQTSFIHALQEVYRDITGVEFEVKTQKAPSMNSDTADLKKAFAELEKSIKENSKQSKKQTKATKENTKAQKAFDISALSRQAFDASFNVKLRELTLGAI